jgi:LCP family protein required for cell wall assembly
MENPPSTRRVFAGRVAIAFGISALLMVLAVVTVNYVIDQKIDVVGRLDVETAPAPPEGANYLVIGSDTREFVENAGQEESFGDTEDVQGQRSDTMMVVHVEPGAQRTLVVSFPRDLWVDIPGVGMSKINAAFDISADKTIETLEHNFGVEINHYIEVDFQSFEGIVKAIGSVPTYFPYPARDESTNLFVRVPGCTRLDGPSSLAYVRSRSLEYLDIDTNEWIEADIIPDINRIERQQDFIRAMAGLAVARSLNDPFTAIEITNRVVENLKADEGLEKGDILSIVEAFRTVNANDQSALDMQTFPWGPGPKQNDEDVLYPDDPAWREMAKRLGDFGGVATTSSKAPSDVKLRVLNGIGDPDTAQAALDELAKIGFKPAGTRDDPRDTVALTEVRYARGQQDAGKLVLSYVAPSARLVLDPSLDGADVALVLGSDFQSILVPASLTTSTTNPLTPTTTPTLVPAELDGRTPAPTADLSRLGDPAPKTPPC